MSLLRLQDNVPEVYINNSRDFQLISRIYDCVNNGVKYDIDSIKYLSDTKNCNSSYLELLKYRQGFINSSEIDSDTLRYILQGFPYIIKNKGNVSGIQEVLNVFSKILHINLSISVEVKNFPDYLIRVIISGNPNLAPLLYRMRVIQDLIKYIVPAGYQVEFVFDIGTSVSSNININERVTLTQANSVENSLVVSVSGRSSILTDFAVEAGGTLTFQNSARLAVPSYVEYIIRPSVESTSSATDATAAYAKTVPTGAKACTVKSIGGKTVVWNQLLDKSKFPVTKTGNGITFTNNGDGSISVNGTATGFSAMLLYEGSNYRSLFIVGHKYLLTGAPSGCSSNCYLQVWDSINSEWMKDLGTGTIGQFQKEATGACLIRIRVASGTTVENLVFKPRIFDLTKLFGAGNEPSSVDDPRIAWVKQYAEEHAEYNAGAIISADVDSVLYNDAVISDIPADVRSLPGYGWSAGTVCNSIERTDDGRWVYVQRVGSRDYQAGDAFTDGVTSYYELETPVTTDITDLMADVEKNKPSVGAVDTSTVYKDFEEGE